jgi:hypothetical protein
MEHPFYRLVGVDFFFVYKVQSIMSRVGMWLGDTSKVGMILQASVVSHRWLHSFGASIDDWRTGGTGTLVMLLFFTSLFVVYDVSMWKRLFPPHVSESPSIWWLLTNCPLSVKRIHVQLFLARVYQVVHANWNIPLCRSLLSTQCRVPYIHPPGWKDVLHTLNVLPCTHSTWLRMCTNQVSNDASWTCTASLFSHGESDATTVHLTTSEDRVATAHRLFVGDLSFDHINLFLTESTVPACVGYRQHHETIAYILFFFLYWIVDVCTWAHRVWHRSALSSPPLHVKPFSYTHLFSEWPLCTRQWTLVAPSTDSFACAPTHATLVQNNVTIQLNTLDFSYRTDCMYVPRLNGVLYQTVRTALRCAHADMSALDWNTFQTCVNWAVYCDTRTHNYTRSQILNFLPYPTLTWDVELQPSSSPTLP